MIEHLQTILSFSVRQGNMTQLRDSEDWRFTLCGPFLWWQWKGPGRQLQRSGGTTTAQIRTICILPSAFHVVYIAHTLSLSVVHFLASSTFLHDCEENLSLEKSGPGEICLWGTDSHFSLQCFLMLSMHMILTSHAMYIKPSELCYFYVTNRWKQVLPHNTDKKVSCFSYIAVQGKIFFPFSVYKISL